MESSSVASYVGILIVQLAYGVSNVMIKIALERGLNKLVLVVYRHLIALFLLAPFAHVLERKQRPSLSFSAMMKIFVLASLGTTVHLNLYYTGLTYTSPTVASALSNVIPALTFLIAFLLRMETVKLTSARGQAKVVGTILCIAGSLVFTFWKGQYLFKSFVERPLINMYNTEASKSKLNHENWIKGSVFILISHIAWSGWLILQAIAFRIYPAPLSLNTLICFIAAFQSSVLALFFARDPDLWKLEWNVQLWTIIYCGVVLSAFMYYLQTWIISKKGPVFVASFTPLLLVIVAILSAFAFAERIHVGSLVGAILIIVGLYSVLWGKKMDSPVNQQAETRNDTDNDNTTVDISCQK